MFCQIKGPIAMKLTHVGSIISQDSKTLFTCNINAGEVKILPSRGDVLLLISFSVGIKKLMTF